MNAPTRYYTDGILIWKFEDGKRPECRLVDSAKWCRSVYSCLATFLKDGGKIIEINTEAGEP